MHGMTEPSQPTEWAKIVASFRGGAYKACLAKLEGVDSPKVRALKARSLLRLDRNADAIEALSKKPEKSDGAESRAERASLVSLGFLRLGRFSEARLAQAEAREQLSTVTAWAVRAELRYHEAYLHFAMGDRQKSYECSDASNRDIAAYYERQSHDVISVSLSRVSLLNARAAVDLTNGRYSRAFASFCETLDICRADSKFDVGIVARTLSNVSSLMMIDGDQNGTISKIVLEMNDSLAWTPDLHWLRFYVQREIGYSFAAFGKFEEAFRIFRAAGRTSFRLTSKLIARLDEVKLLRELGKNEIAQLRLLAVYELAKKVDLSECSERDADALLMLAEHTSTVDLTMGRAMHSAYLTLKARALRLSTAFIDERFYSQQLCSEAAIAQMSGDPQLAEDLKREAFDSDERLGSRWHGARVALELSANRCGQRYRQFARAEANRWPKSSFAIWMKREDPEFA